jgi:hypothetical protein
MRRYQVESGSMRMTVRADDAHRAALWAVHQTLQQVLPGGSGRERPPGTMVLSDRVQIRPLEAGAACEPMSLETCDLVTEWSQLMVALARLETSLAA